MTKSNNLVTFLKKLQSERIVIYCKDGSILEGKVSEVDRFMNIFLKQGATKTKSGEEKFLKNMVRGSDVRYIEFGENINLDNYLKI